MLTALGHEPGPGVWPAAGPRDPLARSTGQETPGVVAGAIVIAHVGAFPWYAVEGAPAERLARRVARGLAARGLAGGVLALDPPARRLGLAIAFDGIPVLGLSLDRPEPEGLASLARLATRPPAVARGGGAATTQLEGALAYAARAAAAVSGESLGHRFFREFKATLDRMADGLPTPLGGEARRGLALLQLTRVLFLYFVQAKGWLGERERFLAEEVDRCLWRRRCLHRDLLRPLFFGTLNRPCGERTRGTARFGAIPFLNGGLFEPHPLERSLGDVPNLLWRDAFDGLFERFHFTVSEGGGAAAIAPDMLGRVFEGVMETPARRATGTFYTPAALVGAILDAALTAHVAARLRCGEGEAERRLAARDGPAVRALEGLTLLDPAAGSGAFLLGALHRLASHTSGAAGSTAARRRVLQRNLFGVDRSAAAVRLSELRLWLAVIADDPSDHPAMVEPLPNLDCLIRQGDSLIEPVGGTVRLRAPNSALCRSIAALRHQLVTANGAAKRDLIRQLRATEARAAEASLREAEDETRQAVAECLSAARSADLFGERRGADRELSEQIERGRRELRSLRAARRVLTREGEVPWFHYQSQFADIFAAGGFDLIVGNPPWLRAEQLSPELRARLAGRYRWWRGNGRGFGHRPDLAVAFIERAFELVAPGGIVALLVPAKLASAGYGAAARHALTSTATLLRVADCTGHPVATFDATVYPLALVMRHAPAPAGHRVATHLLAGPSRAGRSERAGVPQHRLQGGGPWILTTDRLASLAARLARAHPPLGERLRCGLGVKTGANELFLDPPATVERWLVRRAVRGRDLRPFHAVPRVQLLWTHGPGGAPLASLPPGAAAHLLPHERRLRARADFDGGPPWTLYRTRAATARHRVVWADLARRLTAAALTSSADRDVIPLNTCYVVPTDSAEGAERLAGWLNAGCIRALALIGAVPAAGGFRRFSASAVSRLPLVPAALADDELLALSRAARDGARVQEALDDLVARHLGLDARERAALDRLVAGAATDRR